MSLSFTNIMSIKVPAGSRTFFVDLGQNKSDGSRFLSIHELPGSDRVQNARILIDEEYVPDLQRALNAVLAMLESKHSAKAYSIDDRRRENSRAYEAWTADEEQQLKSEYLAGISIDMLADTHGRKKSAIRSRLIRLGILQPK